MDRTSATRTFRVEPAQARVPTKVPAVLPHAMLQRPGPGAIDARPNVVARRDSTRLRAAVTPEHRRERGDPMLEPETTQDVWYVLARARTDQAPRTLAAAQDAVFRRYLPMARTLTSSADWPVDPVAAEQAAELGLAQAVLRWRRPDGRGFEVFARGAIASHLRRLPTANGGDHPRPGGEQATCERPPGQG